MTGWTCAIPVRHLLDALRPVLAVMRSPRRRERHRGAEHERRRDRDTLGLTIRLTLEASLGSESGRHVLALGYANPSIPCWVDVIAPLSQAPVIRATGELGVSQVSPRAFLLLLRRLSGRETVRLSDDGAGGLVVEQSGFRAVLSRHDAPVDRERPPDRGAHVARIGAGELRHAFQRVVLPLTSSGARVQHSGAFGAGPRRFWRELVLLQLGSDGLTVTWWDGCAAGAEYHRPHTATTRLGFDAYEPYVILTLTAPVVRFVSSLASDDSIALYVHDRHVTLVSAHASCVTWAEIGASKPNALPQAGFRSGSASIIVDREALARVLRRHHLASGRAHCGIELAIGDSQLHVASAGRDGDQAEIDESLVAENFGLGPRRGERLVATRCTAGLLMHALAHLPTARVLVYALTADPRTATSGLIVLEPYAWRFNASLRATIMGCGRRRIR